MMITIPEFLIFPEEWEPCHRAKSRMRLARRGLATPALVVRYFSGKVRKFNFIEFDAESAYII